MKPKIRETTGVRSAAAVDKTELPFYRERTLGLLRRYFRLSMETGRLPSLLGRECFRGRVTSYRLHTFEDAVIFIHDVERCLERLDDMSKQVIARIVLQGHTEQETARLLQRTRRHVVRLYPQALDRLSAIFLEMELLSPELAFRTRDRDARTGSIQACSEHLHSCASGKENRRKPAVAVGSMVRCTWDARPATLACQAAAVSRIAASA